MKFTAIGVSKDFKTWSIPVEEDKVKGLHFSTKEEVEKQEEPKEVIQIEESIKYKDNGFPEKKEEDCEQEVVTFLSAELYNDKKNGGTVPSHIILVSVEDDAPVIKETWDVSDYN